MDYTSFHGLYKFRFEWRKRFAQGSPRFTLSTSRMRSRTGLASPVENQACGIAKYPRLRVHRHEAPMTPANAAVFRNADSCYEPARNRSSSLPSTLIYHAGTRLLREYAAVGFEG